MPVRIAILGGPRCGKTTLIQQLYVDLKIRDINVSKKRNITNIQVAKNNMVVKKNMHHMEVYIIRSLQTKKGFVGH